ncbi:MAG: amidohydrolase [Desulfobacteraceae bacterium]|nr:amidohydrolase [Desulfobacteraceae bacterium]
MLDTPLPGLDDSEMGSIPKSMPCVIDAHVHLFPEEIFNAVWKWFDKYGWPVRYKLTSIELLEFLLNRGISHIIGLQYAHKPGIANELNLFMAELCQKFPQQLTGMATVFPGEEDSKAVLENAFKLGLKGIKLHSHVQCFDMNSKDMMVIYETCSSHGKPIVMHVGREPKSPVYKCDPYLLCSADKLEEVIKNFPALKVCVPHLGVDEFSAYQKLIEKYDNLWLDTTMALADYLPNLTPPPLIEMRADRIMYGSDFPNIPYAWDREIKLIHKMDLPEKLLKRIMGKNAVEFFSIKAMRKAG